MSNRPIFYILGIFTVVSILLPASSWADADQRLRRGTRTDLCSYVGGVPLGGIGAGSVEIRGDGSFREWQIFNNWGNTPQVVLSKHFPPFDLLNAFAAVKIDDHAYVLETHPPEGLPGVSAIQYDGWFPFADLDYTVADQTPVRISLEAFGSYIPHHANDSAIPAIGLTYHFKNTTAQPVKICLALSLVNPLGVECREGAAGRLQTALCTDGKAGVGLAALDDTPRSFMGGPDTADALKAFWTDFTAPTSQLSATPAGQRFGQVVTFQLQPGEEKSERFVIGWFFPDHYENNTGPLVGHKYEAWTDSAAASVNLFAGRFDELRRASAQWRDTMKESSWPEWVTRWLCNSQSTIVKLTWWVKDGRFMSYESPECPNSSPVHLIDLADWPVLDEFPELELGLLRHFAQKQEASGKIPEEFQSPGTNPTVTFPGGRDLYDVNPKYVVEIYHRWRETGDKEFLDATWPSVKKAIVYNNSHYDGLEIGLPSGKGISSTWDHWTNEYAFSYGGSVWLAGLKAAENLAEVEGDSDFAAQVHTLSQKALATMNDHLWNGEFYAMALDKNLQQDNLSFVESTYGDDLARFVGLGGVLPNDKALATLRAIANYNRQPTPYGVVITADKSGQMVEYMGDKRAQITTCHCIPAPIALIQEGDAKDQANGLEILKNIYSIGEKQPGGIWNTPHHVVAASGERNVRDFGHYLRDRCIWALLKVLNGWSYDAADQSLTLGPILKPQNSRGPWICSTAYGTLGQEITGMTQKITLITKEGSLALAKMTVSCETGNVATVNVTQDGKTLAASFVQEGTQVRLSFSSRMTLMPDSKLEITLSGH